MSKIYDDSVRGVLQYLYDHDHDSWRGNPFLCMRVNQMFENGIIGRGLMMETKKWLQDTLHPYETLTEYHWHHEHHGRHGRNVPSISPEWPEIRRSYLQRWLSDESNMNRTLPGSCTRKTS